MKHIRLPFIYVTRKYECTHCIIVVVVGNEHGDPSSKPSQGCLHFILL